MPEPAPLQPVRRDHLATLSVAGPIAQHARGTTPDPTHGSCTDDVARSLEVDLAHAEVIGWNAVRDSAWRSLVYLEEAVDDGARPARNFRDQRGRWLDEVGSQDAHGRAILALGAAVSAPEPRFSDSAIEILVRALRSAEHLTALRAQSSALVGCELAIRAGLGLPVAAQHQLAERIVARFEPVAWSTEWPWPEPVLTYESALPARALMIAGPRLGDRRVTEMGLAVLDWLSRTSTTATGHLSPVGNDGWWPRTGPRARFDQQPIEAASLALAAGTAFRMTGDPHHAASMERAYGWFLGANDLHLQVADPARGGCRDGLGADGVNINQGAESTLAWLMTVERIRALRRRPPALAA